MSQDRQLICNISLAICGPWDWIGAQETVPATATARQRDIELANWFCTRATREPVNWVFISPRKALLSAISLPWQNVINWAEDNATDPAPDNLTHLYPQCLAWFLVPQSANNCSPILALKRQTMGHARWLSIASETDRQRDEEWRMEKGKRNGREGETWPTQLDRHTQKNKRRTRRLPGSVTK